MDERKFVFLFTSTYTFVLDILYDIQYYMSHKVTYGKR